MNHTDTIRELLLDHPFGGPEFGGCECGQIIGGTQDDWAAHLAPIIADITTPRIIATADDMAGLITGGVEADMDSADIAAQILAAGFHRDRSITTAEELDALPALSVGLDADGDVWQKRSGLWLDTDGRVARSAALVRTFGPVTVLHEGVRDE